MKLKGWKNIFSFTFVQQVKTKTFIVSTIIIGVIIALISATANILPVILLQDEINKLEAAAQGEKTDISVSKVYIADDSGLSADFSLIDEQFGAAVENIPPEQAEAKTAELKDSSENAMLACIAKNEGIFSVNAYYAGPKSSIKKEDCSMIADIISSQVKAQYLSSQGLPDDELVTAMSEVTVVTSQAGEEATSVVQDFINFVVPMVSSLILFIFIFAYSQLIAQAVAVEKSSRVMEYLLTSVSPLSIIVGKVLAICLVSLMQFLILSAAGTFGFLISMPFGIFSKIGSLTSLASSAAAGIGGSVQSVLGDIQGAFSTMNFGTIIVIIITFILGFLLYALIAGLAGASISKMEDLSAAIQPMSIIGVLGFYLAYIPQVSAMEGETNALMIAARFIPISSPFCLPSAYMLGQMSLVEVLLALLFLLVCVVAMAVIVAKVYEHIVLHTGDRLKLGDMLKMAKSGK